MPIFRLGEFEPTIHPSAYVAPGAILIGRVVLEANASVWSNAVIRADNDVIRIGENSNVQEGAVLHVDPGCPLSVGANVTIGHQVMLHGCTVDDCSLIGIQAVVLNRAHIGGNSLVGAGAVVTEGKQFPAGSLIIGAPAQVKRQLDEAAIEGLRRSADNYVARARQFREQLIRVD